MSCCPRSPWSWVWRLGRAGGNPHLTRVDSSERRTRALSPGGWGSASPRLPARPPWEPLLLAPLHPHGLRLLAFCCPLPAHDGDSSRSVPTWLARPGSRSFTIVITVSA